jgi:ketosteroid isomerase-like protein
MWMSGSHLGSRHDFEATGKHFRARAAVIFQFQEAGLVGARIYYDTGTIARQLA